MADSIYRKALLQSYRPYSFLAPTYLKGVAAWFEKVKSPEGTYAWAWTQLRLGELNFRARDLVKANKYFRQVTERMDHGAEKALGLMNLGLCCQTMDKTEDAVRVYKIARTVPNVTWVSYTEYSRWAPLKSNGAVASYSDTNTLAQRRLWRMGVEKAAH